MRRPLRGCILFKPGSSSALGKCGNRAAAAGSIGPSSSAHNRVDRCVDFAVAGPPIPAPGPNARQKTVGGSRSRRCFHTGVHDPVSASPITSSQNSAATGVTRMPARTSAPRKAKLRRRENRDKSCTKTLGRVCNSIGGCDDIPLRARTGRAARVRFSGSASSSRSNRSRSAPAISPIRKKPRPPPPPAPPRPHTPPPRPPRPRAPPPPPRPPACRLEAGTRFIAARWGQQELRASQACDPPDPLRQDRSGQCQPPGMRGRRGGGGQAPSPELGNSRCARLQIPEFDVPPSVKRNMRSSSIAAAGSHHPIARRLHRSGAKPPEAGNDTRSFTRTAHPGRFRQGYHDKHPGSRSARRKSGNRTAGPHLRPPGIDRYDPHASPTSGFNHCSGLSREGWANRHRWHAPAFVVNPSRPRVWRLRCSPTIPNELFVAHEAGVIPRNGQAAGSWRVHGGTCSISRKEVTGIGQILRQNTNLLTVVFDASSAVKDQPTDCHHAGRSQQRVSPQRGNRRKGAIQFRS